MRICLFDMDRGQVKLGFDFPEEYKIYRETTTTNGDSDASK